MAAYTGPQYQCYWRNNAEFINKSTGGAQGTPQELREHRRSSGSNQWIKVQWETDFKTKVLSSMNDHFSLHIHTKICKVSTNKNKVMQFMKNC